MIIINKSNIEYTVKDTFIITVSSSVAYDENYTLRFIIAQNETETPIINNIYNAQNGTFTVMLTDSETDRLVLGDYIYKLTVFDINGNITTQKSGNFIVKWGA